MTFVVKKKEGQQEFDLDAICSRQNRIPFEKDDMFFCEN